MLEMSHQKKVRFAPEVSLPTQPSLYDQRLFITKLFENYNEKFEKGLINNIQKELAFTLIFSFRSKITSTENSTFAEKVKLIDVQIQNLFELNLSIQKKKLNHVHKTAIHRLQTSLKSIQDNLEDSFISFIQNQESSEDPFRLKSKIFTDNAKIFFEDLLKKQLRPYTEELQKLDSESLQRNIHLLEKELLEVHIEQKKTEFTDYFNQTRQMLTTPERIQEFNLRIHKCQEMTAIT